METTYLGFRVLGVGFRVRRENVGLGSGVSA